MKQELPYLAGKAAEGGLKLSWICLSDSLVDETEIGRYQALHEVSRPLASLADPEAETTLKQICRGIRDLVVETEKG